MAGGQERVLRRRIRSVEATKKITRSFELIAASQIVRAQGRIAGSRPYVRGISDILAETAAESGNPDAPARDPRVAAERPRARDRRRPRARRRLQLERAARRRAPHPRRNGGRAQLPGDGGRQEGAGVLPLPPSARRTAVHRDDATGRPTRTPGAWPPRSCRPSSTARSTSCRSSRPASARRAARSSRRASCSPSCRAPSDSASLRPGSRRCSP